jgi:hypothetical protein
LGTAAVSAAVLVGNAEACDPSIPIASPTAPITPKPLIIVFSFVRFSTKNKPKQYAQTHSLIYINAQTWLDPET